MVYINTGGYDPKEMGLGPVLKVGYINTDVMLLDEQTQVSFLLIFTRLYNFLNKDS